MKTISGFVARMLHYEDLTNPQLMHATPVVVRVDALNYNDFVVEVPSQYRNCCQRAWLSTMKAMMPRIAGAALGYWQTDELVFIIMDTANGSVWMNREAQRTASVAASLATMLFNETLRKLVEEQHMIAGDSFSDVDAYHAMLGNIHLLFHCVAYAVPAHEVTNVLMWRQQRAQGRVVQREAAKRYPQEQIQGHNLVELREMLALNNVDWESTVTQEERNGCLCYYDALNTGAEPELILERKTPNFGEDRRYLTAKIYGRRSNGDAAVDITAEELSFVDEDNKGE